MNSKNFSKAFWKSEYFLLQNTSKKSSVVYHFTVGVFQKIFMELEG